MTYRDRDHFDALTDEIATLPLDERPDLTRGLARTILAALTSGDHGPAATWECSAGPARDRSASRVPLSSARGADGTGLVVEDGTAGPGSPAVS